MKQLLLLFALNCFCYAITLPSISNPAIWESSERWQIQKEQKNFETAFRYAEPFETFHNGKFDFVWSDGFFLAAAGFGVSVLDSIYKELEFSGFLAIRPLNFLSIELGETSNLSWVPENGTWQEHNILLGLNLFYSDWAKFSFLFPWQLSCEINFNPFYSFGVLLAVDNFRIYQQISLGYFNVYNSFSYPGPVLGFGFALSTANFAAAVGYLRGFYPKGHLGYATRWKISTLPP